MFLHNKLRVFHLPKNPEPPQFYLCYPSILVYIFRKFFLQFLFYDPYSSAHQHDNSNSTICLNHVNFYTLHGF